MIHRFDSFQNPRGAQAPGSGSLSCYEMSVRPRKASFRAWVTASAVAALLVTALPSASLAEGTGIPTTVGEPLTYSQIDSGETFEVSLEDAILRALQHNVSLAVERYQRSGSLLGIDEAQGLYDLNLTSDVSTRSDTRPPSSLLENASIITSDTDSWNFGLEQAAPWGGGANLTFNNSKTTSSNENVQPNPQFVVGLFAGYRQPLLRNFGRQVTERNIVVARSNAEINREQFRQQVETVVRQVSDVYWDLVEAKALLGVSEESLALARDLHRMNRIQVEVGTMAPLEMVQSEVGVATREEEIIRRNQAVGDAEDQIRRLVNLQQGDLWDIPLAPTTDPKIEHQPIDVKAAVKTAFEKRADVIQKELANRTVGLDAAVARNQAKPRLDVTAGYGFNAVAGTLDVTAPDGTNIFSETDYGDALDSVIDGEFDGWSITFNFAMPLQNRAAKARAAKADLLVNQAELELRDLKDGVLLDVRRAARAVESAAKAIESANISSKLAGKNLEAEQKRYENGLSTSFRVLEIQEDLSAAQSREVTAVLSYRKALTAFYLLTGQLLDVQKVRLADD